MNLDTITCADIFDLCATVPDGAVDMILCDLPYGTTACSWDTVIPFEPMWKAFKRIIKPRGAIVLTASQPFTSALVMSNPRWFRYEWIWNKTRAANFMNAKHRPLGKHENVLVFSPLPAANVANTMNYFPQGARKADISWRRARYFELKDSHQFHRPSHKTERIIEFTDYPESVLKFNSGHNEEVHPTQKPVALFEYLIRTYTQPGELVFDPCVGSGTTAIAARRTERHFICGDSSPEYVAIANERLQNTDPFQDRKVSQNVVQHSLFQGMAE